MKQKILSIFLFTALVAGFSIDASAHGRHKHGKHCGHKTVKHYRHGNGHYRRGPAPAPAPVVVVPRPPAPGHLPPHPPLPPGAPRPPMPPLPR